MRKCKSAGNANADEFIARVPVLLIEIIKHLVQVVVG
jgi:hypothetical protein